MSKNYTGLGLREA